MKQNIRKQLIWNYCISSVTLLALLLPSFGNSQDYDLIIRGGKVVDGSGNPWYHADIAIKNDRIAEIGQLSNHEAKRVIDAHGLVVAPGFIDPHTHALRGIFEVPNAESALLQGVTTLTEGNDGSSPYPIDRHYADIDNLRISPNWAVFVGQGTIRQRVIGFGLRKATPDEMERMKQMVRDAMEQGALGISTGLFTSPEVSLQPKK